jgi:hypothetical protein
MISLFRSARCGGREYHHCCALSWAAAFPSYKLRQRAVLTLLVSALKINEVIDVWARGL